MDLDLDLGPDADLELDNNDERPNLKITTEKFNLINAYFLLILINNFFL